MALRPWEFGRLTPGEFMQLVDGYRWRQEQAVRDGIQLAWTAEWFSRQKRLQPLERYLKPTGKQDIKTAEERRNEFEELKERLGG